MNDVPESRIAGKLDAFARSFAAAQDVRASMSRYLDGCQRVHPRGPWKALRRIDWGADRTGLSQWLYRLTATYPIPGTVRGLWFAVSEIEHGIPLTWVIGSRTFDPGGGSIDWASRWVWPSDSLLRRDRRTLKAPLDFRLSALAQVQSILRIGPRDPQREQSLNAAQFFAYSLPLGYIGALLADVLPLVASDRLLGSSRRRGIATGFQSGDGMTLGWLSQRGWVLPASHSKDRP